MRDIKFQALVVKHTLSNLGSNMHWAGIDSYEEIIDVHDISFDNGKIDYVTDKDGDEFSFADKSLKSVRQYTGLKDNNGKEIYEGDIIRITFDTTWAEEPYYVGEVKFLDSENYPAFDLRPWIDCEMNALSWLKSESDPTVISYEVIGNIYEDTELFESK
ncbi:MULTISPECIES: YopX family protein [Bacillus]|uniref:YopX family protein n=1 Tax=Bacillus TaxID=1386 RepID=UPI00099C8AAD|nr:MULTISPECIES: YopX family protein [Bacillus amyloliquefaciens group]ASZ03905.1 hypothetical protein CJP14_08530 [Bacillus velezensis]MCB5334856.1 hypothetical protein [Bacillus amyloliquefaciens]OPD42288.1 hypothetical protein BVF98_14425 [Bacillus amyloliquefaciens]QDK90346.1 hypothetical protein CXB71_10890 [Bacillus velezensis]QZE16260.1 hypothetical protein K4L72_10755 [Bacillus velezensis]